MKLSVVIVNYNVCYYVEQCLQSLRKALQGIDARVYVVDNHSRDGSVDYLRRRFPEVKLIAGRHNLGFARANNIAIRQTSSDYVLLLNPDTFVAEDTLRQCVAFMDSHPKAGGLGVRMLRTDGTAAPESRRGLPTPMTAFYKMTGLCARYPRSRRYGKYYMGYLPWDEAARIEVVSGAFFMLRRAALKRVGLLDEDFFMYGEDIDLSYRLLKGGYENWYLPADILHYKGESTEKTSFRYVHVFYNAMLIFLRKHYGRRRLWLTLPVKAAICVKAFGALCSGAVEYAGRSLGFTRLRDTAREAYVFFGSAASYAQCRQIALDNGLELSFVEADEQTLPGGHGGWSGYDRWVKGTRLFAVYDTSVFSYGTILRNFACRRVSAEGGAATPSDCPTVYIGTYNPESNILITGSDVFLPLR